MIEHAEQAKRKAKILIVDDHPIVRQGMAQLINLQPLMGSQTRIVEHLPARAGCRNTSIGGEARNAAASVG